MRKSYNNAEKLSWGEDSAVKRGMKWDFLLLLLLSASRIQPSSFPSINRFMKLFKKMGDTLFMARNFNLDFHEAASILSDYSDSTLSAHVNVWRFIL